MAHDSNNCGGSAIFANYENSPTLKYISQNICLTLIGCIIMVYIVICDYCFYCTDAKTTVYSHRLTIPTYAYSQ